MLIIRRPHTNPYFNIAAEEYILKAFDDDVFMLWQNEPSIIIGKHQNTLAEINYQFVKENKIPVVRRISGGGTVFHDLGNLNFTFIRKGEKGKLVDFKRFTDPIVEVLNQMGVPAKFEGKNDLRVNGLKISGNAEHVFKNRVLHHGTLLFSSDLNYLNRAIKVKEGKFEDRAVKSNRSEVANITDFLKTPVSIQEYKKMIFEFIVKSNEASEYQLTENDISAINRLVAEKYSTWKWNFGYSPKYSLQNSVNTKNGLVGFKLEVKNGIIVSLKITGERINVNLASTIEDFLKDTPHNDISVRNILQNEWGKANEEWLTIRTILEGLF